MYTQAFLHTLIQKKGEEDGRHEAELDKRRHTEKMATRKWKF